MPRCIGRNICDKINKGKVPFYNKDPTASKRYYHIAIQCVNSSIKDSRLCQECTDKEKKTKSADIRNNRLYDSHESVLHDTIDKPVPVWSHIEGGVWFKTMIEKGYRVEEVEMGKKEFPDEKEVFSYIETLNETSKATIIEALMKKYSVFTKTSANRYHVMYKKSKKTSETIKKSEKSENKSNSIPINSIEIDIDTSKGYKINDSVKDEYTVEVVELTPLTIKENNYYYDIRTREVFDLEFNKIGTYENESLKLNERSTNAQRTPSTKQGKQFLEVGLQHSHTHESLSVLVGLDGVYRDAYKRREMRFQ